MHDQVGCDATLPTEPTAWAAHDTRPLKEYT